MNKQHFLTFRPLPYATEQIAKGLTIDNANSKTFWYNDID